MAELKLRIYAGQLGKREEQQEERRNEEQEKAGRDGGCPCLA